MTTTRLLLAVVAAAVALTACSGPSTDELVDHLDNIAVPETWELVETHRIETGGNTEQINAGERCSALMNPECPAVRRWYRTTATRIEAIFEAVDAADQAGFTTESEPLPICLDEHPSCSYKADRDGLRLRVWIDADQHDAPEQADDETLVEMQLSPSLS